MANESFELYSLTSKLDLDTSGFDRAYNATRPKMQSLSQDLKKIETGGKSLGGSITRDLRPAFGGLQASITGLGGPLDSTIGRYNTLLSTGSKLSLSTAGIGAGFGILATGAVVAGAGLFELVKHAADAGDEIYDLTQKVNFSAESISALKNEGQLAGVEFAAISSSLGIFNKNVELANEGDKRLSQAFRGLKVDLRDNETALRQSFKALLAVEDESQQVALAMLLFGKSGKEVLGIIHSMNGDIDASIDKFRKLGSLIDTDAANAANNFSDKLKMLEMRLDGVTRSIGQKLMPTALDALDKLDAALDENSHHAATWADALVSATQFAATQIKYILEGLAIVIEGFNKTFGEGSFFGDMVKGETKRRLMTLPDGRVMDLNTRETFDVDTEAGKAKLFGVTPNTVPEGEFAIAGGAGEYSTGAGGGPASGRRKGRINLGGGGGGGRGGGKGEDRAKIAEEIAKLQLDATLAGLRAEQEANKRALDLRRKDFNAYATQYMAIENRRHEAVVAGLDAEQRAAEKLKKGKDVALQEIENKRAAEKTEHEQNRNQVLDERAKILDQIDNFLLEQDRTIDSLTASTTQWDDAYQQLVDTLKEEGVTLEENTRLRIEGNIARAKELELVLSVTRARKVSESTRERTVSKEMRDRPPWIDLGGGSTVGGEPATTTRGRVVTPEEQVRRERAAMLREKMDQIAYDLTHTIDDAITEGFRHGIKNGVIEFGLGILEMARSAALQELEKAISKAIGGSGGQNQGSGGGGGIWSTILNFGINAIGSLFGGGSGSEGGLGSVFAGAGAGGGFATGGYMSPDSWSWVGERGPELIKAGPRGATVMSNTDSMSMMQGGGMTVIQNIVVPSMYQAGNRQTQTQAMRGLQQAATRGYSLRG